MSTYVYGTLIGTYEVLTPQKINCFLYYSKLNIQGDPKQTDTFEMATTLLWVYSGKKSN